MGKGGTQPVAFALAPVTWLALKAASDQDGLSQSDMVRTCLFSPETRAFPAIPEQDCIEVEGRPARTSVVFSIEELATIDRLRGVMSRSRWIAMRVHAVLRATRWVDYVQGVGGRAHEEAP